jgi:hypothetical protein
MKVSIVIKCSHLVSLAQEEIYCWRAVTSGAQEREREIEIAGREKRPIMQCLYSDITSLKSKLLDDQTVCLRLRKLSSINKIIDRPYGTYIHIEIGQMPILNRASWAGHLLLRIAMNGAV